MPDSWAELVSGGVETPRIEIYHGDTGALLVTYDLDFIIDTGRCKFGFELVGRFPELVSGRKLQRVKGFRFRAFIPLTYMQNDDRGTIVAIRNAAAGLTTGRKDILRLYPHSDRLEIYCDVLLIKAGESYFQDKLRGYAGSIEFVSEFLLPMIPHDATRYYWWGVGTVYTHGEVPTHWTSVTHGYQPTDQIMYWTPSPPSVSGVIAGAEGYPLSTMYAF